MANENFSGRIPTETLAIKFTGKNYATWEFQFRMFLKGKELWGHIDGSLMAPENAKDLGQWETKDARIISWLLGSIEAHMVNNLRPFNTAKEMWDYLKRIYHQDNTARRFQLELEIGNLSQGDLSIEQYYSGFLNLWGEYSNIIYSKVPKEVLASIQAIHEVSKRDQFLMKLRSDFDVARAGLLNRNPVPSLDICLGELLREEQRLATQAVLGASLEKSTVINVAYAAQGRNRGKDQLQCYSCKEFGHIARNCSKKFCNYCKQHGHIIKDHWHQSICSYARDGPTDDSHSLFYSTLTLQGQGTNISSSWIVDSGASNHMTGSPDLLHNVRQYNGSQNIQIANGSNLPITAIGDIGSSFSHVFISPGLSTNLISVGQMVDNHCDVHFSRDGCIVQDQVSGQVIAKGPKVGRLFPLQFSVPRNLSFSYIVTANKADIWHKRLGHPNNVILSNLMKNGFLGDNIQSFKHLLPLACTTCKLGQSKVLPFPTHGGHAKTCFEIIHSDVWGITPRNDGSHLRFDVKINGLPSGLELAGNSMYIRYYLIPGNGKKICIGTRDVPTTCNPCSNEIGTIECLVASGVLDEALEPRKLMLELGWKSMILGRFRCSKILARVEVAWKDFMLMPNRCLLVETKVNLNENRSCRRMAMKGCDCCEWIGSDEDMFLAASALNAW
ncbi:hypothetical protein ZIOFF_040608 [Zingiber officinale]|uniref:CCHC-type domain-containing protein n=1 Tax=Zingiber officinale TaxID=94328 RepID=A0A8J5L4N2_ZINOF|nr:hypothetical protein ZIOFF_040608 [Zingiber officinale]